jgi:hypothetical protein
MFATGIWRCIDYLQLHHDASLPFNLQGPDLAIAKDSALDAEQLSLQMLPSQIPPIQAHQPVGVLTSR